MLRVIVQNIMGREYMSVLCTAHDRSYPHLVWSKQKHVGPEDAASELHSLADGLLSCLRSWERGEWDFTDDCYPGSLDDPDVSREI
jgi:hypothetical protein